MVFMSLSEEKGMKNIMRKAYVLIGILILLNVSLVGCGELKKESDQKFGDQNFKTSIALIELHKVRTGEYPENLEALEFLGDWDQIYLQNVSYIKLDEGYELNLLKGWVGMPEELTYPAEFWEGLGLVKSNLKTD